MAPMLHERGETPEWLLAAAAGSLLTCSYSSRSERLTLGADSKASFSRISVRSLMVWLRKLPAQKWGRLAEDHRGCQIAGLISVRSDRSM